MLENKLTLTISRLWPLGGGHEVAQPHPPGPARPNVEAVPAALEEDDPLLGAGLLAQVVAGMGAVVAGDARVGQIGALQRATVVPGAAGRVHHHVVALDHVHAGLPERILVQTGGGIQAADGAGARAGPGDATGTWQLTKRGQEQQQQR